MLTKDYNPTAVYITQTILEANRTMSQLTKSYPPYPTLLIISLNTVRAGIILLHAHPQAVYCNCGKFHQV